MALVAFSKHLVISFKAVVCEVEGLGRLSHPSHLGRGIAVRVKLLRYGQISPCLALLAAEDEALAHAEGILRQDVSGEARQHQQTLAVAGSSLQAMSASSIAL
jgi:hypothetical protein